MALEESELESTVDTDDLVGKGAENKSDELAKEDQESGLVVEESDAIVEGSDAIVDEPQASTKEKPRARTSLDPPGEEPTEPVKKRDLSVDVEKKRDLSVDVKKTRDLSVDVKKQSNLSVGVEGKSEIIHERKEKVVFIKKQRVKVTTEGRDLLHHGKLRFDTRMLSMKLLWRHTEEIR